MKGLEKIYSMVTYSETLTQTIFIKNLRKLKHGKVQKNFVLFLLILIESYRNISHFFLLVKCVCWNYHGFQRF